MASSASDPAALHRLAVNWETVSEAERAPLRALVERLVRYPCKLAAVPLDDGGIHLVVFSVAANAVKDYLELQPTGAIGVIFHLYDDPDSPEVWRLSDACDDYNASVSVDFESDSESDGSDDSDDSESEEDTAPTGGAGATKAKKA
jgi:hypothetical protein